MKTSLKFASLQQPVEKRHRNFKFIFISTWKVKSENCRIFFLFIFVLLFFCEAISSCRWQRETNKIHSREFPQLARNVKIVEILFVVESFVKTFEEIEGPAVTIQMRCLLSQFCRIASTDWRPTSPTHQRESSNALWIFNAILSITSSKVLWIILEPPWRAWTAFTRCRARSSRL